MGLRRHAIDSNEMSQRRLHVFRHGVHVIGGGNDGAGAALGLYGGYSCEVASISTYFFTTPFASNRMRNSRRGVSNLLVTNPTSGT